MGCCRIDVSVASWILQGIVGLGLLNVWLVRARSSTAHRGRDAKTLREEFGAYGLPTAVFWIVGALEVTAGIALIVGIWVLVLPAAAIVAAR